MNEMKEEKIKRFKKNIAEHMEEHYGINKKAANNAVQSSVINDLLKEDTEMVMRDSIEYWAEQIWNEYSCARV